MAIVRSINMPIAGSVVRSTWPTEPRPNAAGKNWFAIATESVCHARDYVTWFLTCIGLSELCDDANLVVSELVTNAIDASIGTDARVIAVSLRLFSDRLLIEVIDSSPQEPVLRDVTDMSEEGRGLVLVAAISKEWGYFRDLNKKVVFSVLEIPKNRMLELMRGVAEVSIFHYGNFP